MAASFIPKVAARPEKVNLQVGTAVLQNALKDPAQPKFPDYSANYQNYVTAQTACEAKGGTFSISGCDMPAPDPGPVYEAPVSSGLIGQIGYSLAGGNCVDMAIAYGKDQPGNPISWYATTGRPFIGAAALFYFNHVAIVVGIWGNGDIEVAQENSPGAPHRYSQSEIRGYF